MDLDAASEAASKRFATDSQYLLKMIEGLAENGESLCDNIRVELISAYKLGRKDEAQKKEQA